MAVLYHLDFDILCSICQYLSLADLATVARLNRPFLDSAIPFLYKTLLVRDTGDAWIEQMGENRPKVGQYPFQAYYRRHCNASVQLNLCTSNLCTSR